jgi:predicted CopG family antitoxin
MPVYKGVRLELSVYNELITLQQPRESLNQLIHRLINFYRQVKLDVTLVDMPGSKKKEEGG